MGHNGNRNGNHGNWDKENKPPWKRNSDQDWLSTFVKKMRKDEEEKERKEKEEKEEKKKEEERRKFREEMMEMQKIMMAPVIAAATAGAAAQAGIANGAGGAGGAAAGAGAAGVGVRRPGPGSQEELNNAVAVLSRERSREDWRNMHQTVVGSGAQATWSCDLIAAKVLAHLGFARVQEPGA